MCINTTFWLEWERENLAPYAVHSDHPWYTRRNGNEKGDVDDRHGSHSRYRTAFEIDKDRITNSQGFRRLEYKTQVFVTHEGDNYRTRLTHTLEVAENARHIARSLRLNEHLAEAIALGHDVGHAPYGHIAEKTINTWLKEFDTSNHTKYYFCHNNNSLNVMEYLEPGYDWDGRKEEEGFARGLNLTQAVKEGIVAHTSMGYRGLIHERASFNEDFEESIRNCSKENRGKGIYFPGSLEAQIVRIADDIAQRVHDLEDGLRSAVLKKDDIKGVLFKFLRKLNLRIFSQTPSNKIKLKTLLTADHIEHKYFHTKIWKLFLDDVITRFKKEKHAIICKPKRIEFETRIKEVNRKLRNKGYRNDFILAAQVAFLLHMWRDYRYWKTISEPDYAASTRRVFKYLKLLKEILTTPSTEYPAYHIIAFLRGCMVANVVEHSFWNIHHSLDPEFRHYGARSVMEKSGSDDKWYIIFVLVDGLVTEETKNKQIDFQSVPKDQKRYCFAFKKQREMQRFCEKHFERILRTNGNHLKTLEDDPRMEFLERVCWLNKSEEPGKTRYVKLVKKGKERQVRIERVRVYFTGYKDLCPGIDTGSCRHAARSDDNCMRSSRCKFWSSEVKYPDTSRLVEFQGHMQILDSDLKKLISAKIHNSSSVARMNYMGETILSFLLNAYCKNPKLMHGRVWSRLRTYPHMANVSQPLHHWIAKPIANKEGMTVPDNVLKSLTDTRANDPNREYNQFSLEMRIIEHLAGMTDRYISNEYNRLTQSGREVERQDETYFFY